MTDNPGGAWRVLILDRDPLDPKWILAFVPTPGDIRDATPFSPHGDQEDITAWVRSRGVPGAVLVPLTRPLAWRVDETPEGERRGR